MIQPALYKIRKTLDVCYKVAILGHLALIQQTAITGADRINDDNVADIQRRMRVVFQLIRLCGRRELALLIKLHSPRAEKGNLFHDAAGARSATENEDDGPPICIHAFSEIGSAENRSLRFTGLTFKYKVFRYRIKLNGLSVQKHGVRCFKA